MIKLLQKQNGAVFYASQCSLKTDKWLSHFNGESLSLVQYCFTGLVQRIFNRDKFKDNKRTQKMY